MCAENYQKIKIGLDEFQCQGYIFLNCLDRNVHPQRNLLVCQPFIPAEHKSLTLARRQAVYKLADIFLQASCLYCRRGLCRNVFLGKFLSPLDCVNIQGLVICIEGKITGYDKQQAIEGPFFVKAVPYLPYFKKDLLRKVLLLSLVMNEKPGVMIDLSPIPAVQPLKCLFITYLQKQYIFPLPVIHSSPFNASSSKLFILQT